MINAHRVTALTILVGSCVFAPQALAAQAPKTGAGASYIGPGASPGEVLVVERGGRLVRPTYSDLCQYKPVMTDEDMLRCGIGVTESPKPPTVLIVERRRSRTRR